MNFSISKHVLSSTLNIVAKAISNVAPLPALSGVKIDVFAEEIVLTGSDSNLSIKKSISAADQENKLFIFEEGSVVIDVRYISEIVRKLDGDIVTITTIDGTLMSIKGLNAEFKINGMRANDYPDINFCYKGSIFKLETKIFEDIVRQTAFACSEKDIVPSLTGVNFVAKGDELVCNASDSYRLSCKRINLESPQNFNIIIPAKTLNDVASILGETASFELSIDENNIFFIAEEVIIRARLIEDAYRDVSKLLPTSFAQELEIKAKTLLDAVDRASFIKYEGKSLVKLEIFEDKVDITSYSQEIGSSHETLPIISFKGNPIKISCSGKYLSDAIKALRSEEILLGFSGELRPIILKKKDSDDIVQLISPVRSYN